MENRNNRRRRIAVKRKISLFRGFYEYQARRRWQTLPPRHLIALVTYRCNSRCLMCNIWREPVREEMGLEQYSRVLDDPLFQGIESLTISGGEPSLFPQLGPLVELFMSKMPSLSSLSLITNGLAVERVLEISRAALSLCAQKKATFNVSVSLDGVGPIHDEMRGVPGAFSRVERCLGELQRLRSSGRFWLGAGCVVTHKNLGRLEELESWCDERRLDLGYQLVGFDEAYLANADRRDELDFSPADLKILFPLMEKLASRPSLSNVMSYYWHDMLRIYRDKNPRRVPCPLAINSLVLDAYGDVYYCRSAPRIGNCLSSPTDKTSAFGPVSAVYYDPKNLSLRKALTQSDCLVCSSGCLVAEGIKKELKGFLWYLTTRRWNSK